MDTNQKLHQNNLVSINRDKLRNLFLMHQGDIETKIPEFAKELKHLLNINPKLKSRNNTSERKLLGMHGENAKVSFAHDLSKKFFNNFHKEEFKEKEEIIQQNYNQDLINQAINKNSCMKQPSTTTKGKTMLRGKQLKKHARKKHKLAALEDPLKNVDGLNVPNKYFCIDCGINHYNNPRECEHCGEVHGHCCEVY